MFMERFSSTFGATVVWLSNVRLIYFVETTNLPFKAHVMQLTAVVMIFWIMSLACIACHSVDSPTHSLRSSSVSSSEGEGRCGAVVSCLTRKVPASNTTRSKVAPISSMAGTQGIPGTPRLVRSRAVTRDVVRDWNFDEVLVGSWYCHGIIEWKNTETPFYGICCQIQVKGSAMCISSFYISTILTQFSLLVFSSFVRTC